MATRVLVIESDATFANEVSAELSKLGCSVEVTDDGNAGVQAALGNRPDLILLAIELPRINGYSICNKLRKETALKDVPLVVLSSESSDETFDQHRKLRTHADDYIRKPIHFDALLQRLERFNVFGGSDGPSSEDYVVVDELVVTQDDDEGGMTQVANRDEVLGHPQRSKLSSEVDEDIEDMADRAFSRLASPDAAGQLVLQPAKRASTRPPKPAQAPTTPPPGNESAEVARLKTRTVELERELEEARTKTATGGGKAAGVSSRDFLDLREALNKKDKEILSLRESLSRKDKEIVEAQDRGLLLERAKADLDDRVIGIERELADSRDRVDSLAADKELSRKVVDDLKHRHERAKSELDAKLREVSEQKSRHAEELAALEASKAAQKSDLEVELSRVKSVNETSVLALNDAHAAELARQADDHAQAMDHLRLEHDSDAVRKAELAEQTRASAVLARETELRADREATLAALHRSHEETLRQRQTTSEDEVARLRAEHDADRETQERTHNGAVADLQEGHEAAIVDFQTRQARTLAQEEERRVAEVAAAETEGRTKLEARERELITRYESEVTSLRDAHDAKVATLETSQASELSKLRDELARKVRSLEEDRDERLSSMVRDHERQMLEAADARAESERALRQDRNDEVQRLGSEHQEAIATLANDRDSRIASIEATAARNVDDVRKGASEEETRLHDTIAELERAAQEARERLALHEAESAKAHAASRTELDALAAQVEHLTTAKSSLEEREISLTNELAQHEVSLAGAKAALSETRNELGTTKSQTEQLRNQASRSRESLERAKDALAAALGFIEEGES